MSTSATNNPLWRIALPWLILTAVCIAVANIYALFGHGVRSAYMDYMFLFPLVGGVLFYPLLYRLRPAARRARFARNLHNSGIAALCCGCMLRGIFEIAGSASAYVPMFFAVGAGFVLASLFACFARRGQ